MGFCKRIAALSSLSVGFCKRTAELSCIFVTNLVSLFNKENASPRTVDFLLVIENAGSMSRKRLEYYK